MAFNVRPLHNTMMKAASVVVDTLLGFAVIALVPFAWIMRDGLGPDAVESSGASALGRCFMTFWAGPIVVTLAVAAISLHLVARKQSQ